VYIMWLSYYFVFLLGSVYWLSFCVSAYLFYFSFVFSRYAILVNLDRSYYFVLLDGGTCPTICVCLPSIFLRINLNWIYSHHTAISLLICHLFNSSVGNWLFLLKICKFRKPKLLC